MKKRNRLLLCFIIFAVVLIFSNFQTTAFAESNAETYEIVIDGKTIQFNEEIGLPFINASGRTMFPLRIVSENMGYEVTWNQETKTAKIIDGRDNLQVTIGSKVATKNSRDIYMDRKDYDKAEIKAELVNGKTYVPARFIAEAMGANVGYNKVLNKRKVIHQITIATNKVNSPLLIDTTFNSETDVMADGRLTKAKTTEYIEKMIEGTSLRKEGGKYYLKFDRPAIADGYVTSLGFNTVIKSGGGYTLGSGSGIMAHSVLPGNQSFEKELDPFNLVDAKYYKFTLGVMTPDERFSTAYYIWYYPDRGFSEYVYLNEYGHNVEYLPFDKSRLLEGF